MFPAAIHAAARILLETTGAHRIILYGSPSRGDDAEGSCWNLAVILPDDIEPGQWTPSSLQPLVSGFGESFHVVAMRKSVYDDARLTPGTVSFDIARDGLVIAGSPGL